MLCKQKEQVSVNKFATKLKVLRLEVARELTEQGGNTDYLIKKTCNALILYQFKTGLGKNVMKQIGLIFVREPNLTFEEVRDIQTAEEML